MNRPNEHEADDRQLLGALLRQMETATEASRGCEVDEELLALFAAGALDDAERDDVVRALAGSAEQRRIVSALLSDEESGSENSAAELPEQLTGGISGLRLYLRAAIALSAAAMFVGGLVWLSGQNSDSGEQQFVATAKRQLELSDFDQVLLTVAAAREAGIYSDRLKSLEAQAYRQIPHVIALATVGRVSDFGYGIGGLLARGPNIFSNNGDLAAAKKILGTVDDDQVEVLLNRGHVYLSQGDPDNALDQFTRATECSPNNALACLGCGLAYYMKNDWSRAEAEFRRSLELGGGSSASRWNLAMTLDEQGRWDDSIPLWESLLKEKDLADDHPSIRQHLNELYQLQKTE